MGLRSPRAASTTAAARTSRPRRSASPPSSPSASSSSSRSSRRTTANTSSLSLPSSFAAARHDQPRFSRMSDALRPLLPRASPSSDGADSAMRSGHARSPQRRWVGSLPPLQSAAALERLQRAKRSVARAGPALRAGLLGTLAVAFGVLVLLHTQSLATTAGLPRSGSIRAARHGQAAAPSPPLVAGAANCSERFFAQRVDHFSWLGDATGAPATFQQRYLVNTQFWDARDPKAAVFFYTGNEGDVTMYANHTGLMWENAAEFKALVVFAEHRYYGQSLPFGEAAFMDHLAYLTHDQALADYTALLLALQREHGALGHPVIAFGGSYGGMLSAWMRIKYPGVIAGAIAASAPIFGFPGYGFKGEAYWQIVTRDATPAAGAAPNCAPNLRRAWPALLALAETPEGRETLSRVLGLCAPLASAAEGDALALGLAVAFDSLAMGNFPYPSSYMSNDGAELPAWPVRVACEHLAGPLESDEALLAAVRDAANVFYNAAQDQRCFKTPTLWDLDGVWDYQYCAEMLPQETYFPTDGERDMFWPRQVRPDEVRAHCRERWRVDPDPDWIRASYGDELLRGASNIVFSNGMLDPWSSAGVREVPRAAAERGVVVLPIEEGAHHLDLFFSRPALDPPSVVRARKVEVDNMRKWVDEFVRYK